MTSGESIPLEEVLGVIERCDEDEGVSLGFVAWELLAEELAVLPAMQDASSRRLIETAGWDEEHAERLWRLTDVGRSCLHSARPGEGVRAEHAL
jgi:hypothetical protein